MKLFDINIPKEIIISLIIIVIAFFVNLIIKSIIKKIFNANLIKKTKYDERRIRTVLNLVEKFIKYLILTITIISILGTFHINTTAIITSVGAVSLVVGLAFQDILKDFLVGISIIFENNFSIGDMVEINGFKGEVISFSLKSTRIKSLTGEVRIISNRQINEITNFSLNKSNVLVNINVSYESDLDKVEQVLKNICETIPKKTDRIDEVILCDGVEELSDSSIVYRLTTLVNIKDIYYAKRLILKEVKVEFDKNNISIPYPQVEVHNEK